MAILSQLKVHESRFLWSTPYSSMRSACLLAVYAAKAKKKSISGKAAAGVLILLLFICLCAAAWFKMQRVKGAKTAERGSRQAHSGIVKREFYFLRAQHLGVNDSSSPHSIMSLFRVKVAAGGINCVSLDEARSLRNVEFVTAHSSLFDVSSDSSKTLASESRSTGASRYKLFLDSPFVEGLL